jgi:hypothetical protein
MITCPWCGTSYAAFQSNCDKCGGPLSPLTGEGTSQPAARASGDGLPRPPPAPRPISDSYAWSLIGSDGWAVAGFIFALLGAIFTLVGAALTLGIITAFVGIPFVALGLLFLGGGAALLLPRYQAAQRTVGVLRMGEAASGQIARVEQNLNVRVNGRYPWTITYQFRVQERDYEGRVTTLNPPGPELQPGSMACILYSPQSPEHNSLYPHP